MRVRFWGTRGSLAKPGPTTLRYGGNTACVEVRADDGTLIVLDCGTGAHGLGQALLASGEKPLRGHLLITHTHWDHIQGFPFFAPLFVPGNEWDIYAPGGLGQKLEATLSGQMEYEYFPVRLEQLGATIRFHDLVEGTFQIGGVTVTARYLNHPAVVLGYRLEADGVTLVYATDHEPHGDLAEDGAGVLRPVHDEDRRHVEFLRGADLAIHDAQYTTAEYHGGPGGKRGWGHTTVEQAADFAAMAGVERLALIHHDPTRNDEALDDLVVMSRARPLARQSGVEIVGAAEGMELRLSGGTRAPEVSVTNGDAVDAAAASTGHAETVLVADDDADILALLAEVLEPEGLHVLLAGDGEAALQLAKSAHPALILLDWQMPGRDGLDVLRTIRASEDVRLRDVPVLLLTARSGSEDTAAGFEAGATDYLTKPFAPAHVRSRVREWLLRARTTRASRAAGVPAGAAGAKSDA
ncbi:MAG TPA: response regulator [Chloroflexota bacterium]|nr:response regulator [Chloroflexota bacterium]